MCDAVCVVQPPHYRRHCHAQMCRPTRGAFSSSRQASASDLLPSPAALATRARRQPVPRRRRSVAALVSLPPRSSTSRDSWPICCGSGHSPAGLVACRSDASSHLHSAPRCTRLAPYARHLVACAPAFTAATAASESSTPTLVVNCASHGGRRVLRNLVVAAVSAPSAAGPSPLDKVY
jgi:hypothetical protein